jgi:HAD superfamily hydrolase (TIGR01509 family)
VTALKNIVDHMINNNDSPIHAVLFDLSGTTLDERYLRHGLAAAASEIGARWSIDPAASLTRFMPIMQEVSAEYAPRAYYRMSEVICELFARLLAEFGYAASHDETIELEQCMWAAAIPSAAAADGAIETLMLLRDAGIRTGIVSYADTRVFRGLLSQSGLAGLTDVELCSEEAESCKPHPRIFLQALAAIDTAPANALFVGDSIDADIIGANRVGMRTALLSGREFNLTTDPRTEPEAQPTHRITNLIEVANLPLGLSLRPTPISA